MRIRSAALFTVDLPLADPFQHASSGRIDALNDIVLRLESEDGHVGYGEVRGNVHYTTGDSPGRVLAVLRDMLVPALLGMDASSPCAAMERIEGIIVGNTSAKTVIDSALHDLLGKALGVPVHVLLGGRLHESLLTHATLPFTTPEETKRRAADRLDKGFRILKLRVGLKPFERDVERTAVVREAIDGHPGRSETILGIDANQGWRPKEAIRNIRRLSEFGVSFAEQPVLGDDYAGLREIRRSIDADVIADESCGTPEDLLRLIREEAADSFHFKLYKGGGIAQMMRMAAIAESAGFSYVIGQSDEGMLATAAAVHCGLVCRAKSYELWGFHRIAAQPYRGIEMREGAIHISGRPGLGIEVDEGGLDLVEHLEE
jgi:L-alanine-DL-glutamate epimerase-like enolase superfamily enzyme